MGKAKPYKPAHASCTITMDPITGSLRILNAKGKEANLIQMLGYLFVAGVYGLYQFFTGADDQEWSTEDFAAYLENTQLEVKQNEDGDYYLAKADTDNPSEFHVDFGTCSTSAIYKPSAATVVEKKQGTTIIYQIQNLNVYLSAEVVHQLNMNPQQVMNIIQDQVNVEISKIEKTEFKPGNP